METAFLLINQIFIDEAIVNSSSPTANHEFITLTTALKKNLTYETILIIFPQLRL